MNAEEVARHLRTLGVAERLITVYRHIVDLEPCTVDELSASLAANEDHTALTADLDADLVALADLGLVHSPEDGVVRAVFPGSALARLAARRSAEVDFAHLSVLDWVASRRRVDPVGAVDSVVEVLRRRDVAEHVAHLETTARRQVRLFDSPPYFRDHSGWTLERDNLDRGVAYRVVYATASLSATDALHDLVAPCIRAGEQARAVAGVPLKLMIVDERVAVVGTAGREDDQQPVVLVKPSSLLDGLAELFELTWRQAMALDVSGRTGRVALTADDRRLLTLLATGAVDEQIARAMDISKRTFFRRLQRLMDLSGTRSRYQLAVHATRDGWV